MKVGDLVKLLNDPEVHRNNSYIDPNALGLIVEWAYQGENDYGPLASAWVRWQGNSDWDSMYAEDLEIVSESR